LKAQQKENTIAKGKCDFYGRGLALCSETTEKDCTTNPAAVHIGGKQASPTKCKCGMMDHLRISCRKCKLNPKNIALRAKAAMEEAAKNAPEANMNTESNCLVEG